MMIVHGGLVHMHYEFEQCLLATSFVYHIDCHTWTAHPASLGSTAMASSSANPALASHTAAWHSDALFVIGGFDGVSKATVHAFRPQQANWCSSRAAGSCDATEGCGHCERNLQASGECLKSLTAISCLVCTCTDEEGHSITALYHPLIRSSWHRAGFTRDAGACLVVFDGFNATQHQELAQYLFVNRTADGRGGKMALLDCAAACRENNCSTFNYRTRTQSCELFRVSATCAPLAGAAIVRGGSSGDDCALFEDVGQRAAAVECRGSCGLLEACGGHCHPDADCVGWSPNSGISGGGTFICRCNPGFVGNGTHCAPMTGCAGLLYNALHDQCTSREQCAADGLLLWEHHKSCSSAAPPPASLHIAEEELTCFPALSSARDYLGNRQVPSSPSISSYLTGLEDVRLSNAIDGWPGANAIDALRSTCAMGVAADGDRDSGGHLAVSLVQLVPIGVVEVFTAPDANPCSTSHHCSSFSALNLTVSVLLRSGDGASCSLLPGSNTSYGAFNCSSVATGVQVRSNHPAGLRVCDLRLLPPVPPSAVALAACGLANDGIWVEGQCTVDCSSFTGCFPCARVPECSWCPGTGSCNTREFVCAGAVNASAECAASRPRAGATQELYYQLIDSWTPEGLVGSIRYQRRTLDESSLLSAMQSVVHEPDPVGEIIHACLTPSVTDTYYLWIRSVQGIKAQLYFNPLGCDPDVQLLVAHQPRGLYDEQRSWVRYSAQRSSPFYLEAGRSYYIMAATYMYSHRYYGVHDMAVAWTRGSTAVSDDSIITAEHLTEFTTNHCANASSCLGCSAAANCVWCDGSQQCEQKTTSTCETQVIDQSFCAVCSAITGCSACLAIGGCEWSTNRGGCRPQSGAPDAVVNATAQCDPPCATHSDCGTCTVQLGCGWCASTGSCYDTGGYRTQFAHGQCLEWQTDPSDCRSCETTTNCADCTASRICGWCYDPDDPSKGHCTIGNYEAPAEGQCRLALAVNGSASEPSLNLRWSFDRCVDVDECK